MLINGHISQPKFTKQCLIIPKRDEIKWKQKNIAVFLCTYAQARI